MHWIRIIVLDRTKIRHFDHRGKIENLIAEINHLLEQHIAV